MKFCQIITNIEKGGAWVPFCIIAVLAGCAAWLTELPPTDIFEVYAPSAEAFARGDWKYAFHPRTGVFFPALSGSIAWVFSCSGERACQIASISMLALSCFPLFALFGMIWDRRTAWIATLLTAVTSHMMRFAAEGLRDSGKLLALALLALGLCGLKRDAESLRYGIFFCIGSALLVLLRGEGGVIVAVCGIYACFIVADWKRIAAGTVLFLLLLLPQLYYNFRTIGYPVPELRYGAVLKKAGILPPGTPEVEIPESAL